MSQTPKVILLDMNIINISKILSIFVPLFYLSYFSFTLGTNETIDSCSASVPKRDNGKYLDAFFSASVDIKSKQSNCQYEYSARNNIDVFTAKERYKFNLITEGSKTIWHTMDDSKYSEQILVDSGKNHLRIKIKGGDQDYRKENNTWKVDASPPSSSSSTNNTNP
ncbi:conserved hypothetical protein [Theileria orientalis strain Shintoku]|uniref:Uncharacterized protein n=1 Tax=Theileria orientalis strain Shintoku TaxID=869250 RepID=J4DNK8_THEOR|nr:conserved hypothetical protein [Theileria orientalis strain Shintoku]PVC52861.1 hypothetical protein MACL_00000491 [Theileria orientalis]BAM39134.1 conserved hypothetical protein [Theileria orientalis strain Shintoku]|eukprot:XP_009689435.1 conserved hypothetical protein [Theileria orientalis strain Shintoku]